MGQGYHLPKCRRRGSEDLGFGEAAFIQSRVPFSGRKRVLERLQGEGFVIRTRIDRIGRKDRRVQPITGVVLFRNECHLVTGCVRKVIRKEGYVF